MYIIRVKMQKPGKKGRGIVEPVEFALKERPGTVEELITELVELGVKEYNERKAKVLYDYLDERRATDRFFHTLQKRRLLKRPLPGKYLLVCAAVRTQRKIRR